MKQKTEILDLNFMFAPDTIAYFEALEENRKFVIARRLVRSGTSIGANVREAQNADSKQDFVHKLKIAANGASETQ